MLVKSKLYHSWKNGLSKNLKRRRFEKMLSLCGLTDAKHLTVLEIGCSNGRDAMQFMADPGRFTVTGIDILPQDIPQENVTFVQCDAASLPFDDDSFDLVISLGLLEHIEPIDKLADVISEISRVGRAHANVVPSVNSPLEPHTLKPFWGTGLHKPFVHKRSSNQILKLNFFSDHSWTKFRGFEDADVARFWYLFPLVKNTIIYRSLEDYHSSHLDSQKSPAYMR